MDDRPADGWPRRLNSFPVYGSRLELHDLPWSPPALFPISRPSPLPRVSLPTSRPSPPLPMPSPASLPYRNRLRWSRASLPFLCLPVSSQVSPQWLLRLG
ncbi:hypothetical protein L227DRAFT_392485 [Lentinus tigrinus ALCF2SS1-6]|uniref:Uncharacterized protein n=1 Tax=Lentinus tigrinus ALCF2SS1-6 TaxID=1328759 RepID=A0A5C2SI61_9APHY|nr:hypothetical protein L227DRAFT_392485 [Lentinus tigrinus ALCF2SS1-6]